MHYGAYAFSTNTARKTIATNVESPELGRHNKLSDKDVLRLRMYYNCGEFDYGEVIRCPLKTVNTIGNCQRLVFKVRVSQHMHKITNLWTFELNRSSNLRDNNERKKRPCHTKLCAFWCLISKLQILNSWKITSFSKTTSLQRELFLTTFYTITFSPLLVIKKGFMLIIKIINN